VVEATIIHIETSCKKISGICYEISTSYLLQIKHRSTMREKFERAYKNLKENLIISYEKCSSDLEEVQIAWDEYRGRVYIELCSHKDIIQMSKDCKKFNINLTIVLLFTC
jgi:metal-dependent hydrolase (beta-lactamase superfamily II)